MKRLLICLMLWVLLPGYAQAEEFPPALAAAFAQSSRWNGWIPVNWAAGEELAVVIQRKDQTNALCVLVPAGNGSWKLLVSNAKAIYQGERLPHTIELDGSGAFNLWYGGGPRDNLLRFAMNQGIWRVSRLEIRDEGLAYEILHVYSDKLIYASAAEDGKQTTVHGVTPRNLASFSLKHFPRTPEEARASLSNPPELPEGSSFTARLVDFQGGQKFAVYTGPGGDYLRPVEGRCVVSTNDWIQVFGQEGGWLLIQYARSPQQMRFGYISGSALEKSAVSLSEIDELGFNPTPIAACRDTFITDDPLFAQEPLTQAPQGSEMTCLAALGEWAYIEAALKGERLRGFAPLADLEFPAASRVYPLAEEFDGYAVSGQGELTQDNQLTLTLRVTGSSAGRVAAYQVYLNNTPAVCQALRLDGTDFSLSLTLALQSLPGVIGLCPVDAAGNLNTLEALTLRP